MKINGNCRASEHLDNEDTEDDIIFDFIEELDIFFNDFISHNPEIDEEDLLKEMEEWIVNRE